VEECLREAADDFEATTLPEADGAFVGADDKIELHGAEAAGFGVGEGVSAHGASDAAAGGVRGGDVAAVGDVGAAALLIGAEEIGAEDGGVFFGDEDFVVIGEPEG